MAGEQKLSIEDAGAQSAIEFPAADCPSAESLIIMTGHTAGQNAETLLMNLLRGSGVTGLAGIPPVRSLGKGSRWLPAPCWAERSDILTYAELMKLEWHEDETNASTKFTRNRVRHELIPLLQQYNPNIVETLNSTAAIMRGIEQYLGLVSSAAKGIVTPNFLDSLESSRAI